MTQPSEHEIEVFNLALELPAAERATYLDRECTGDAALRRRVEELLKANEESCACLEDSAAVSPGPGGTLRLSSIPAEKPGDKIGRYKLLQQIGEGGCGVVYMAEQEAPIRRRVALKVIKLGMDTKSVIARFEAERQALALMDHPNIAKVLDAGATETGRPYFVMELVRGVKITDYCDQNHLSTPERLDLFIQVCRAIQHAHQKGIIHRDIKPSNILVTLNDGVPLPKVIDFGIAKATQGKLTDETLFTAFEQFMGTPAYMSPEQAMMTSLDIDTRSDIYSLGVLLYELLTGMTPFDTKALLASGLDELRRTIRETEPMRPSTRLRQTRTSGKPPLQLSTLRSQLSTDLDWIVMKSLEKDRARRYETANGLALDIQRHLQNEPIVARPPTGAYRFQKLVRRNKAAFAAAALIAVVLVAATGISAWQAVRANREARRALRAEALAKQRLAESDANANLATQRVAESEAISKFLTEVFKSPDPARDGRTITVAESLANAAKKLETELTNQTERRAKLQATLGATYYALGLDRDAIPLDEKVRDYYLGASGLENPDTLRAMGNLARPLGRFGRRDEALKLQEQVLVISRKVLGPEHLDTLQAMHDLAFSYWKTDRFNEAIKLQEPVLALRRKLLGREHPDTLSAMNNLANSYSDTGRKDEALRMREQVVLLRRKLYGPEHPDTLSAMNNLASSYDETGRHSEVLKLYEQVLAGYRKFSGPEYPVALTTIYNLAHAYEQADRWADAVKLWEEALAALRETRGPNNPTTIQVAGNLADSFFGARRYAEAMGLLEESCRLNPKDTDASLTLAIWQTWFGQGTDYEATRYRLVQQADGTDDPFTAERAAKVACLMPTTNAALLAKALVLAQRSVELGKSKSSEWLPCDQLALGLAEYRHGRYAAAEQTLFTAEQTAGDIHALSVDQQREIQGTARLFRAMSLFRQDKPEEARKLFSQARAKMPTQPKDESKPIVDGKPLDRDSLVMWLAYKEAKALLEGPSAPVTVPLGPK